MPRKGENIYKRKDGRWEGRYIKARSKTGKAVYGYVYAPTYKEAKRKRSQAIINIEANQTTICKVPETTMPTCFIRKLANDWMNSIQSQIKKSSYVKYYNILHVHNTMQRLQIPDSTTAQKTRIMVTSPKSKCSIRTIPIPDSLIQLIQKEFPKG